MLSMWKMFTENAHKVKLKFLPNNCPLKVNTIVSSLLFVSTRFFPLGYCLHANRQKELAYVFIGTQPDSCINIKINSWRGVAFKSHASNERACQHKRSAPHSIGMLFIKSPHSYDAGELQTASVYVTPT